MAKKITNPILNKNVIAELDTAEEGARVTYSSVSAATASSILAVLAGAVFGWHYPVLGDVAGVVAFLFAWIVMIRTEKVNAATVLCYALLEGAAVGGLSSLIDAQYRGIVVQAILGTVAVSLASLAAFRFGGLRIRSRFARYLAFALWGLIGYSVLDVVLTMTGAVQSPVGLGSVSVFGISLGVLVGVIGVLVAAAYLIRDLTMVEELVDARAPKETAWLGAWGITMSLVLIYLYILEILEDVK